MHTIKSLLADFVRSLDPAAIASDPLTIPCLSQDILLTVAGYPMLKDINRDALRFCPYGIAPGARL